MTPYSPFRMKTDQKDDILFIPVDITVSVNPGLYISEDKLDFGFGSSLQEPSTFPLEVLNSARRVIKVTVSYLFGCFLNLIVESPFLDF